MISHTSSTSARDDAHQKRGMKDDTRPPTLLLGIMSNNSNHARRMLVRRTWLPSCHAMRPGCDAYFVLRRTDAAVEAAAHGDMLQLDRRVWLHFSTYNALLLPWFKYAAHNYPHAYIAKVRDVAVSVQEHALVVTRRVGTQACARARTCRGRRGLNRRLLMHA